MTGGMAGDGTWSRASGMQALAFRTHAVPFTMPAATDPPSDPSAVAARRSPGRITRWATGTIRTLHRWAESGWGGPAVGSWGFLQASVVPGPTEAVLVPLGIADPQRAYRLAMWAIGGALLGGIVAYLIGAHAFESVGRPLLELVGISERTLAASEGQFARRGWALVALSTVSPLSSKLVCLAAGAFGMPFWVFGLALLAGRAARFMAVATLVRYAGPAVLRRMGWASAAE